ncbi:MAG: cell division protein ZapE [Lentimonas sp.]|jgi:cell division protein ZapE
MHITYQKKSITLDANQVTVYKHLVLLKANLEELLSKNTILLKIKRIFGKTQTIKSLYIYGKVGRGKSMLMKNFFDEIPPEKRIYFHFNEFMQIIHQELFIARKEGAHQNPIARAVKKVIGKAEILCFDEMQVEDVADAMILRTVFSYFVKNNIALVLTSNCHPLELYENGLQRNLFLKFVNETLLENFEVLNLDGETDYRSNLPKIKQHYFYPINEKNRQEILGIFQNAMGGNKPQPKEIETLGRKILVKESYQNIALFDFKDLCESDFGVADFGAITKEFSLIFLINLPILKPEDRNEAKRLIWFIDEAYERNVNVVVLAQDKPENIYIKGTGFKAFKRTASRLNSLGS